MSVRLRMAWTMDCDGLGCHRSITLRAGTEREALDRIATYHWWQVLVDGTTYCPEHKRDAILNMSAREMSARFHKHGGDPLPTA